jgi:hypothetical protein
MLDANLEWTEQLGEAYLADPAAVMDAVQGLRHRARSAGRLVTTPQEIVRTEQEPARIEEPITIQAPSPEIVYVPVCDPSFAYGPWPYPDYPPFFPVFAGASIGGCGWISGPIIAPLWGWVILNFPKRHIDIDRKRLALFDRDKDRERDRGRALVEEWRHDPGHRGNVPYRNAAVRALFGSAMPAANVNSAFRGRWTGLPRIEGPLPVALPQEWRRPGIEGARPVLGGGRPWPQGMRAPPEGGRPSTAGAQPRFRGGQPALEGVDPVGGGAPTGEALTPDAATRMRIQRRLVGPAPPIALAPPMGGLRASPSFGGIGSTQSPGDRRFFQPLGGVGAQPFGAGGPGAIGAQPLGGVGAQPFGARGPGAIGAQPLGGVGVQPFGAKGSGAIGAQRLNGRGPQPFGGMGAGSGRGGS